MPRRRDGGAEPAPPALFAAKAELHKDQLLAFAEDVAAGGSHLGELLHEVGLCGGRLRGLQRLGGGRGHDGGAGPARRGHGDGRHAGGGGRAGRAQRRAGRARVRPRRLHRGRPRVTSARARDRARRRHARRASRPRLRIAHVTTRPTLPAFLE